MKKIITLIIVVLCYQMTFSNGLFVKAEEISMNNEVLHNSVVYSAGLINSYSLLICSDNTSLLLTAKTKGNYSMKKIGLKNIVVQRSSNNYDWNNYLFIDDLINESSILFYTLNQNIANVQRGYYYRVACTHYAKESGIFGSSESINNVSESIYVS